MDRPISELLKTILAGCRRNAAEIGRACSAALGRSLAATIEEAAPLDPAAVAAQWDGAGWAAIIPLGEQALVALVSEASSLLPAEYRAGAPAESLAELARELARLCGPEGTAAEQARSVACDSLAMALAAARPSPEARRITIHLSGDDGSGGGAVLLGPVERPAAFAASKPQTPQPTATRPRTVDELPPYTQSLLNIHVPISVTLATKKQPVQRIIELGPGAIIQFEKSCEEMLDLEVNGRTIAEGEPVKVGDKFGLRITSMKLPHERFIVLRPKKA